MDEFKARLWAVEGRDQYATPAQQSIISTGHFTLNFIVLTDYLHRWTVLCSVVKMNGWENLHRRWFVIDSVHWWAKRFAVNELA